MIALLPATFMIMSVIASIIIQGVPIRYTQYSSFDSKSGVLDGGCYKFIKS